MNPNQIRVGNYVIDQTPLNPRDAIRWAVGNPKGRRSSVWRLWGDKKGDVYLSTRSLGSRLKASFHRDRRCSIGFTSEYHKTARERFGEGSRHWERWTLPNTPVVRVAQVVFPYAELAEFETEDAGQMVWLPTVEGSEATVVSIFVAEPPAACDWRSPADGRMFGYMRAPTRMTWAVHASQLLPPNFGEYVQKARLRAAAMPSSLPVPRNDPAVRMFLWGQSDAAHDMFFLELAASGA